MTNITNIMTQPSAKQFAVTEAARQELSELGVPEEWTRSVLAIYDRRKDGTLYAPVGKDDGGNWVFVDLPEYLFNDQVVEI